ncbi:MAG: SEC-C domain-containing protein [Elusimicrobia bacterium]|nr:SEC-C domain-containing protein [Elusimicrobiota bacterium]
MASSIGRNDPCPCGSGRKHKKCCLPRVSGDRPRASLTDRVATYALRATSPEELQAAWEEYGETGSVKRPDAGRFGLFMDWFIADRRQGGRTLLQSFEAENGAGLSAEERAELERHKATHTGVYEVVALRPGTGLTVKDIFTGEETKVADVSSSRSAATWDVLVMRLRRSGGPAQAWGEALLFSPLDRAELKFELEAAYRTAKTYDAGLDWRSFLDSAPPLLRRLEAEFRAKRNVVVDSAGITEVRSFRDLAAAIVAFGKRWVDEPVPALGGRTPRRAAADPEARGFLLDLLKEYERSRERAPDEAADISLDMNVLPIIWMRKSLGLPIPKALSAIQKRLAAAARGK